MVSWAKQKTKQSCVEATKLSCMINKIERFPKDVLFVPLRLKIQIESNLLLHLRY